MIQIIAGDCRRILPQLAAESILVDAIVTDPPYGLEFMGKKWDAPLKLWETGAGFGKPGIGDRNTPWPAFGAYGAANPTCAKCGGRARGAKKCCCAEPDWKPIGKRRGPLTATEHADHMNRSQSHGPWGRGERPINPNDYGHRNEKCLKCGKWRISSNRCQCESPEFESRMRREAPPAMLAYQEFCEAWALSVWDVLRPGGFLLTFGGTRTQHRMVSAIEDAGFVIQDTICWLHGQGFPKHRSHLKPAFEPITVAYKPGGKRTLQVDECRIGIEKREYHGGMGRFNDAVAQHGYRPYVNGVPSHSNQVFVAEGRWPANVCHDGSDEVMAGFPDAPGQLFGVGERHSDRTHVNCWGDWGPRPDMEPRLDGGSAARFYYCAKADAEDRWGSKHPTVKPVELLKWLVPLVTPLGGTALDPFAGSGTTGVAALATGRNAILIEQDETYITDIRERLAFYEGGGRHSVVSKNRNRRESKGTLL